MNQRRCGFIGIVGRPNAGKSTLLNALLGEKVSIVSPVPQTTRHRIRGILTRPPAQFIFVDTPGVHSIEKPLASRLNAVARGAWGDADALVYVVDVSRLPKDEEERLMRELVKASRPIVMALNKIDGGMRHGGAYIQLWQRLVAEKSPAAGLMRSFLPLSARTGQNLPELLAALEEFLPRQDFLYEPGTVTDFPLSLRIADIIREQLCLRLRDELPHETAVVVKQMRPRGGFHQIEAQIYVARPSQKAIVLGLKGSAIKEFGSRARQEMGKLLKGRVFLKLEVAVKRDWQESRRILQELGFEG